MGNSRQVLLAGLASLIFAHLYGTVTYWLVVAAKLPMAAPLPATSLPSSPNSTCHRQMTRKPRNHPREDVGRDGEGKELESRRKPETRELGDEKRKRRSRMAESQRLLHRVPP